MFEIWSVGIDSGEYTPMFKELESEDFTKIFSTYMNLSKKGMYVIIAKKILPISETKNNKYIFESPDGGKTVTKRRFLSNDKEEL